jgi:hypothetical protein
MTAQAARNHGHVSASLPGTAVVDRVEMLPQYRVQGRWRIGVEVPDRTIGSRHGVMDAVRPLVLVPPCLRDLGPVQSRHLGLLARGLPGGTLDARSLRCLPDSRPGLGGREAVMRGCHGNSRSTKSRFARGAVRTSWSSDLRSRCGSRDRRATRSDLAALDFWPQERIPGASEVVARGTSMWCSYKQHPTTVAATTTASSGSQSTWARRR